MALFNKFKNWVPVIIFIVAAILFRLYRTSGENHYLLAGSDGPYLPLQVRNLFEHYRLAFSDMPLLFVLCTIVAKFFFFLKVGTENDCILIAIRLIDSFLPPIAAIPVFFIVKELYIENMKSKFSNYFLIAFSILNFTPLYLFSFQLQKNGLATIFIFLYLFYILRILNQKNKSSFIKAFVVLILCVLTHFGSFCLVVLISFVIFLSWFLLQEDRFKTQTFKTILSLVLVFITTLLIVALFDFTRFKRLINIPFKIFEAPVLLFAVNGQNFVLKGQVLFILISMNLLSVIGLFFLLKNRKRINSNNFIFGIAMAICTLFLSNPFLGLEWASRFFMLAYIPSTILYLTIYNATSDRWIKISSLTIFLVLLFISLASSILDKPRMAIDNKSYQELLQINEKKIFLKDDAIVASQSLRILSNWVLRTKGVDKYLLTKDEFKKYSSVYLLKQIKGRNPMLRGGQPNLGDSILQIYNGEHFEVFKLINNKQLPENPEKIFKGVRGTVHSIRNNELQIIDKNTNRIRKVYYDFNNKEFPQLFNGMKVEVNGEWFPFSISIKAETIKEIKNFEDN